MWSILWRAVGAAVGLFFLRAALYRKHWGHGRLVASAVNALLGVALAAPLWTYSPSARPWLMGAAVVVLLPWRRLAMAVLNRRMRRGLEELARAWGTEVEEGPEGDLLTVHRPADGERREAWAGNVLTRVGSLHPGVSTSQTYRMMAFVVRLEEEPALRCSLLKGWRSPAYHETEWRESTVMQGERFRLSMGTVLSEDGRETGGSTDELDAEAGMPDDERFDSFSGIAVNEGPFFEVFSGDLLDDFFTCAFQGVQFECNVTPTSVNIYTIYLGPKEQKRNVAFLERLADAVEEKTFQEDAGFEPPADDRDGGHREGSR